MLSVVIPVYNVKKYLDKCIKSVLKIKDDFEIILIDDGSTDGSEELCDIWATKDERIKVIHKTNGGLSSARNVGIKESNGDYIMFLDSDDFINSDEANKLLERMKFGTEIIVGFYRNYYADKDYYEVENCDNITIVDGISSIECFLECIPTSGRYFYMTAWRFVVSRKFILENQLFFVKGLYHEDEEWTMRLLCKAQNVDVCHCYFYEYRQAREGAITSAIRPKNVEDRFKIICNAKQLLEQLSNSKLKTKYIESRISQLYLSNMIDYFSLEQEERKKIYSYFVEYRQEGIKYLSGPVGMLVRMCSFVVGIKGTCYILDIIRNFRKKINKNLILTIY